MSNAQQLTKSCMIERSDNFSHTENSSSHQNRSENHAFKHADEKFKSQEFNESTDHISWWSVSEVHKQLKNLKMQNVLLVLQLHVLKLEWETRSISDHRYQHNDDHYWSDARKHTNRSRKFREQSITNYDFLIFWLRDCKDFIVAMSFDFITKEEKLQWSASYLSEKSHNQWWDHVMNMHNYDEIFNWKYYIEYLRAKLNNSEIRNFQTEHWFKTVKQWVD